MRSPRRYLGLGLGLLCAMAVSPTLAQTFFDTPRTFIVARPCNASRSTRVERDPVPLTVGQGYTALGENSPTRRTHVFIQVDGEERWVALGCGRYTENAPPLVESDNPVAPDCLPFFDHQDNPEPVRQRRADVTPPPPPLDDFDTAVTGLCGAPGQPVSRERFRERLRDHPAVLASIREFTGNRVFADGPAPADEDGFLDDLTDAWFARHGFEHIFCGELERDRGIGGFHFHGRYWQLQQQGLACRFRGEQLPEVKPGVIYTIGVRIRGEGDDHTHPTKGYGYTLDAADILKLATRAFRENPPHGGGNHACLLAVRDDGAEFEAVFVNRDRGIVTFFPDAYPDRNTPRCRNPLSLP